MKKRGKIIRKIGNEIIYLKFFNGFYFFYNLIVKVIVLNKFNSFEKEKS